MISLGAIVLTGGTSSRMGADKATLLWDGRRAVDRIADLAREVGAVALVTVGDGEYGLPATMETPGGGGPVAGVMAGAAHLRARGCDRALVLAVDAPTILAGDIAPLLRATAPGAAFDGLHLPLVVDLDALPRDSGHGWAMGRLVEVAGLIHVACAPEARARLRGANTPEEMARLVAGAPGPGSAQGSGIR